MLYVRDSRGLGRSPLIGRDSQSLARSYCSTRNVASDFDSAWRTLYDEQNRVQGVLDVPLSERGRGEVMRMAQMLSYSLGNSSLAALYCGPGENVIRTAEIVGKTPGVASQEDQ